MPELPEVETIRRCITPLITGKTISSITVRNPALRFPVPEDLAARLAGQRIEATARRGKYLLLHCGDPTLLIHLGMSGRLLVCPQPVPPGKHDHVDIVMQGGPLLRLNDARRFGCLLWTDGDPLDHPLLADLGPEPLESAFTGAYLHRMSRNRSVSVKDFIMNARVVVGVGNIYASEALFAAGIHPHREAGRISAQRYRRLAEAVKRVLADAIAAGGTTFRDYRDARGDPGSFQTRLMVYAREDEPCRVCGSPIRKTRQGGRSSFHCDHCQK